MWDIAKLPPESGLRVKKQSLRVPGIVIIMDNHRYSSFKDRDFYGKNNPKGKDVKIVAGRREPLSNNQQAFNRLTKRIEQLQQTILTVTAKLESLLKLYTAKMPALTQSLAKSQLALAEALGNSTKKIKFGKRQIEDVRAVILALCDEAFSEVEPDEEHESFYDAWAESSYREELKNQSDKRKKLIAEDVKEIYGIDIDADDIDDTPEGYARFVKRLKDEFLGNQQKSDGQFSRRKKTERQFEREELRRREEALKLKSLRGIYISLAKALHPDTITDPAEKAWKEELMKKVTAAYADRDLSALLKLEMEWVSSANDALDTLPDEKLKLYIASLKEQAAALERDLRSLYYLPRFKCISEFSRDPESHARQYIHDLERNYTWRIKTIEESVSIFSRPDRKKEIIAFVNEYLSAVNSSYRLVDEIMIDF